MEPIGKRMVIHSMYLIEEVRKRPELYDLKLAGGTPETKKQAWEDIAMSLFEDRWRTLDKDDKEGIVREIQVKWKSLRDNFTRVLRRNREDEAAGVPNKRKKYIYYDQLSFLAPYTSFRKFAASNSEEYNILKEENESTDGNISNIIYMTEGKDSNDSTSYVSNEENPLQVQPQSTIGTIQPVQFIQLQANSTLQSSTQVGEDEDASKRIAKVLEQLSSMQREEKCDDPMGNKKFLLSLLPFMKKLPDDVNLEVRLQLMSVIQSYSTSIKNDAS